MWPHEGSVTNPDFQNVPKAPVVFSVTDTHITVQYFFHWPSHELFLKIITYLLVKLYGLLQALLTCKEESDHLKHRFQIWWRRIYPYLGDMIKSQFIILLAIYLCIYVFN